MYLRETRVGVSSLRASPTLSSGWTASLSMGWGCRMLESSLCGALVLKGGERIEIRFKEFILETILIRCI